MLDYAISKDHFLCRSIGWGLQGGSHKSHSRKSYTNGLKILLHKRKCNVAFAKWYMILHSRSWIHCCWT